MKVEISFKKELEALKEAGLTEEQTEAIWYLVARVSIKMLEIYQIMEEQHDFSEDMANYSNFDTGPFADLYDLR